jgi:molecular chaperone GrpE
MDDEIKTTQEIGKETTDQYGASDQGPQTETEAAPVEVAGDEVTELKAQVEEFKDRYLRAYAEMDNMRKRLERDRQEFVKYSTERLLRDILLVYDAVHKSIATAEKLHPEDEPFTEGLRMIEKLFFETLKKYRVEPIQAQNVPFDPNYHEALMQVNTQGVEPGIVVEEIEKGFMIHDRVLRPAKVTVSG